MFDGVQLKKKGAKMPNFGGQSPNLRKRKKKKSLLAQMKKRKAGSGQAYKLFREHMAKRNKKAK